jgi:hypothetical protein
MLTPEQEQQIIDLALRRRLLTPEQVELHAPESRPPSATADARRISAPTPPPATTSKRGFPTYGPRIDRLRRLGLIDDATINELNTELRSSEMTTETAAVKTGEQPPSAGSAAVRVQLPLPEPLRRWTRYELLDVLGQGGMGVVYKARDRRLGRMVALKFIRLSDPKMAQRFLNEARAQARITHDNICKMYAEKPKNIAIMLSSDAGKSWLGCHVQNPRGGPTWAYGITVGSTRGALSHGRSNQAAKRRQVHRLVHPLL